MKARFQLQVLLSLALALPATGASAATIFSATISGDQVGPNPVVTDAFGTASFLLNDAMTRFEINIQIFGLDLDGNQTPGDTSDDVTVAHIHNAPAGSNGGVVFGFIGPDSDLGGDLVIDAVAGTIFSGWDLGEGNGTTLEAQLPSLLSNSLYVNIHTTTNPGGEIRGQIVLPEPATAGLLALGLLMLRRVRRR